MWRKILRPRAKCINGEEKTLMKAKVFVDSNLFVYLASNDDPKRQKKAKKFFNSLEDNFVVISTQVLKEISSVLLKKKKYEVEKLQNFLKTLEKFEILDTPLEMILRGLTLMSENKLSFYDSLIVAAAESANCKTLYSEDMSDGQEVAGVKIINPLA